MSASEADIYSSTILERARRPRHQHRLEPFDIEAREVNRLCGDRVTLRLRCDEQGAIAAVGYEARACAICTASADLMAEIVPGMTRAEALSAGQALGAALRSDGTTDWSPDIMPLRLFEPLRDTPSRIVCATLPWQALAQALAQGLTQMPAPGADEEG